MSAGSTDGFTWNAEAGGPDPAVEARPQAAAAIFGPRLDLADRFVTHLATTAVEWGLIGPRELPRLWSRHVLNCAVLAEVIPAGSPLLDVGSGAGLPGVALAIARPDLEVTLVEPLERRATWLTATVHDLGLDCAVRRARAEDLAGTVSSPVVTARAVAELARLARWTVPLVAPGGVLLAIKGRRAADELQRSVPTLRRLGAAEWDVVECGASLLEVPTTVVRVGVPRRPPARRCDQRGTARR